MSICKKLRLFPKMFNYSFKGSAKENDNLYPCKSLFGGMSTHRHKEKQSTHRQEDDGSTWSQVQLHQGLVQVPDGELPSGEHGSQWEVTIAFSHFLRKNHRKRWMGWILIAHPSSTQSVSEYCLSPTLAYSGSRVARRDVNLLIRRNSELQEELSGAAGLQTRDLLMIDGH